MTVRGGRKSITRKKLQTTERSLEDGVKNLYGPLSYTVVVIDYMPWLCTSRTEFPNAVLDVKRLDDVTRPGGQSCRTLVDDKALNLGSGLSARIRGKRRPGLARGKFTAVETVRVRAETDSKGPGKGRRA